MGLNSGLKNRSREMNNKVVIDVRGPLFLRIEGTKVTRHTSYQRALDGIVEVNTLKREIDHEKYAVSFGSHARFWMDKARTARTTRDLADQAYDCARLAFHHAALAINEE